MAISTLAPRSSLLAQQVIPSVQLLTRSVATFAFTTPKESLARQVIEGKKEPTANTTQPSFSLRNATATVARRHQWQTMPIEAPRSLEAVMLDRSTPQARIVTEATYPYRVVYANKAWENLCGWSAEEAIGRAGLSFMQGEATDKIAIRRINSAVREGERISVQVVNYKKDGTPFLNNIQITPLRSRYGEYTHMLGILSEVPDAYCQVPEAYRRSSEQQQQQCSGA